MAAEPKRKLTQDERSALSDRRLVDAAIGLIVRNGTAGTTLQALGEAAGYSRGQVTYRFGSKAGLFKAVIKLVSERWRASLESRVEDLTGPTALMACTDAYFEFVRESPNDIRALNILSQLACEPDSPLKMIVCRMKQHQASQLCHWIREGQAADVINPEVDADACAAHFIAFYSGITQLWMLDPNSFDWARVQAYARRQLLKDLSMNAVPPTHDHV